MKDSKSKTKIGSKEPTVPGDFSFEEAMRKIMHTSKEDVENAIEEVKKRPRGKNSIRDWNGHFHKCLIINFLFQLG